MKKEFTFRKHIDNNNILHVYATYDGWTNEYTENDFDLESLPCHNKGTEITEEEAREILNSFGYEICQKCGDIYVDVGDCVNCYYEEVSKLEK